jgi:hypothetical protein
MLSHCMVRMDGFALCTKEFGLISGDRVCDYSFLYPQPLPLTCATFPCQLAHTWNLNLWPEVILQKGDGPPLLLLPESFVPRGERLLKQLP